MKRILALFTVLAIMCAVAGCASISDTAVSASNTESGMMDSTAAPVTETLPINADEWERVISWYDDDIGTGGSVIPDLSDYCLARIVARVTRRLDGGCEAEVLVPYETEYPTYSQDYYFSQEIRRRLQPGDTVTVRFADDSLIVWDSFPYIAWKHGAPSGEGISKDEIISIGVSKLDADNAVTSDCITYGDYYSDETVDMLLKEQQDGDEGSTPPLSELPYAVVRLKEWTVTNRRVFEFTFEVLEKSENLTWVISNKLHQGSVMYAVPNQEITGFDAPTPAAFPVGSILKIYYDNQYDEAVYMEPIEWNE